MKINLCTLNGNSIDLFVVIEETWTEHTYGKCVCACVVLYSWHGMKGECEPSRNGISYLCIFSAFTFTCIYVYICRDTYICLGDKFLKVMCSIEYAWGSLCCAACTSFWNFFWLSFWHKYLIMTEWNEPM